MTAPLPVALDVEGRAAPPRSNGQLVFAEPWESRAFGLAMAASEAGGFEWEAFRQALIARISAWERSAAPGKCYSYYTCWAEALEQVLVARELVVDGAVQQRAAALAARPAGHDHVDREGQEHVHDHDH
jgi:nitrile hydratase accessory protein